MDPYRGYEVSVVDSDGDRLLEHAPIEAMTFQSAWQQALVIAFRVCEGSFAPPMTITVVRLDGSPNSE